MENDIKEATQCRKCTQLLHITNGRRMCLLCGWEDYSYNEPSELSRLLPQPFRPSRISLTYSGEHTASTRMMVYAEIDPSMDRHGGGAMYRVWCPWCEEEMSYSKFGQNKIQKKTSRAWSYKDGAGHELRIDVILLTWW